MDRKILAKLISSIVLLFSMPLVVLADNPARFLVMADIHFDPFSSCKNTKPCPLIQKLRVSKREFWPALLEAADPLPQVRYGADTNYPLLKSALSAASQIATQKQIDFVIVLGDFLSHEYRRKYKMYSGDNSLSGYQSFVDKTYSFLNQELLRSFPVNNVFPVIGNNDTYQFDYSVTPSGRFFQDIGRLWVQLIKDPASRRNFQREFGAGGYYAVALPPDIPPNLRLIVLNSTLFSRNVKGKGVDKAALTQLDWLHQQLLLAKSQQQKVFIVMHIPEGIDVNALLRIRLFRLIELWKPLYLNRFHAELEEFAPEISTILTAHLHTDWSQTLRFGKLNEVNSFGNPGISPIYGTVPGFKIYSFSPKTGLINDFDIYYYSTRKGVWLPYGLFNNQKANKSLAINVKQNLRYVYKMR